MIIINEKYALKADTLNYVLMENKPVQDEESKNFGKTNWTSIAFVSDLKSALTYLVDKEVRDTELSDLQSVVNSIAKLKADIQQLHFKMK